MTAPQQPFEHLQSAIMRVHNREVNRYFSGEGDDDIETPKGSLKAACKITDNDAAGTVQMRLFLFWVIVRKLRDSTDLYYGVPIEDYQETFKFRPQISLAFAEHGDDVDPDYYPVTGEISFRLMGETSTSLTEGKLRAIAAKIKANFATPPYRWRKGKDCYSYTDREHGYKFKIFARAESEARELIEKVLDIQNHTPDWSLLRASSAPNATSAFPTNPGSQSILGKSRKKPRSRPIADVYFVAAIARIWGQAKPVYLVDVSGYHWDALETTY